MMRKCIAFFIFVFLLVNLTGCESFARKFTRKSKKSGQPIEMVLVPQEYTGPQMSKEELYRQYYLYWQSWHDELINAFTYKASVKKQVDCANEAAKNLANMGALLNEDKQKKMIMYIDKLKGLKDQAQLDIYGTDTARSARNAERLKSNIMRDFTYPKIKNYMR
ncbi:MAG: hypothetical protein WC561_01430 [Candidatus Omnitrophota bacterium]|jgi:hypothetical protein